MLLIFNSSVCVSEKQVRLRILDLSDFRFRISHVGRFSAHVSEFLPSLGNAKVDKNEGPATDECRNPFSLPLSRNENQIEDGIRHGTHRQELEEMIIKTLKHVLILTDVNCLEWTPLINYYSVLNEYHDQFPIS